MRRARLLVSNVEQAGKLRLIRSFSARHSLARKAFCHARWWRATVDRKRLGPRADRQNVTICLSVGRAEAPVPPVGAQPLLAAGVVARPRPARPQHDLPIPEPQGVADPCPGVFPSSIYGQLTRTGVTQVNLSPHKSGNASLTVGRALPVSLVQDLSPRRRTLGGAVEQPVEQVLPITRLEGWVRPRHDIPPAW